MNSIKRKLSKYFKFKVEKTACYYCNFFGMCMLKNYTCKDFKLWDGKTITYNLDSFFAEWIKEHNISENKDGFRNKRSMNLFNKLKEQNTTIEAVVNDLSNSMIQSVEDSVKEQSNEN